MSAMWEDTDAKGVVFAGRELPLYQRRFAPGMGREHDIVGALRGRGDRVPCGSIPADFGESRQSFRTKVEKYPHRLEISVQFTGRPKEKAMRAACREAEPEHLSQGRNAGLPAALKC